MQVFVVVTEDETIRIKADAFIQNSNGTIEFYAGDDERSVALFRANDVKRIYEEQGD